MDIERFYEGDYGDGTHYVGVVETDGRKTVVARGLCRANAVECVTFGNDLYVIGYYIAGSNDYFDGIIEQIAVIDRDRAEQ